MKDYISLATATFYPSWPFDKSDKVRGDLAIETLKAIKQMGLSLYISDGGSSEGFLTKISSLGYKIYTQKKGGLSAGRRQALTQASLKKDSLAIVLFEPEKVSFIKECLIKLVQSIIESQADMVIPKRDEESFLSYPYYQASSERLLNSLMASMIINALKKKGGAIPKKINEIDFLFGPKIISNKPHILDLFMDKYASKNLSDEKKFQCEVWANALFFPLFVALYKGSKVISLPVSYFHPKSQTLVEKSNPLFIRKREHQFKTLLDATKELLLLLENNPKSRIKYTGRFYE
ncbi:MAG: hypothetical protein AAB414_02600 [Patescibacteria group bacterium]